MVVNILTDSLPISPVPDHQIVVEGGRPMPVRPCQRGRCWRVLAPSLPGVEPSPYPWASAKLLTHLRDRGAETDVVAKDETYDEPNLSRPFVVLSIEADDVETLDMAGDGKVMLASTSPSWRTP